MRGGGAYVKDLLRAVRGSLGRFLAIMGITALGCGFYAGLKMCGPDMRAAADAWYDGYRVWDLRLVSTLGWGDDDLGRIAAVEGVEAVMPATTVDVMARLGTEQVAVRIATLDVGVASSATPVGLTIVDSADGAYLNRVRLVEGAWPRRVDECVVSADTVMPGFGVGSLVEVLATTADAEDLLVAKRLRVVGTVSSANYPYTANFGSTSLGSGMVEQYVFVTTDALAEDAAYTDAYVRVAGADAYESESDAYLGAVGLVADALEARSTLLASARLADVRSSAQDRLDERVAEVAGARRDAESQLASGKETLAAAAEELATGGRALAAGEAEYAQGVASYRQGRDAAEARIAAGEAELASGEAELVAAEERLAAAAADVSAGEAELASGEAELARGQDDYDAGLTELAAAEERLATGEAELAARTDEALSALAAEGLAASSLDEAASSLAAAREEAAKGVARLDEAADGVERLRAAEAELASAEAQAGRLAEAYERVAAALVAQGYARADVDAALVDVQGWTARAEAWARERGVGEETIEQVRGLMSQGRELLDQLRQLSDGKVEVSRQREGLLSALAAEGLAASSLDEAASSLAAAREEATKGIARLDEAADGVERLRAAEAELASGRAELEEGRARLDVAAAELAAGRDRVATAREALVAGREELAAGRATLLASAETLAAGRAELASGRAEATRQLAASQTQLDVAAATLAASRARLEAGRDAYERGLAEWEARRDEVRSGLADADEQLAKAQGEIDALSVPDLYVLDRTKSEGAATYHADTERMDAIAAVFPLMFFLVAALVALTTMTRMVEDERTLMGTYKALGYGTAAIAARYLAYAAAASVVGALAGVALLSQVLPTIVMSAYGIIYAVPSPSCPLPVSLPVALASGGLGVGVTLAATWVAVVASLRETPATLMLPRSPAVGRRILLERVGALWRLLSFSWKVTFRNLFRYKRRLLMTVVGISGCTALLLVGFGLHDAIWDIIDCQYGPIIHYDTTIGLDATATEADVGTVVAYLEGTGEVDDVVRVHGENMQASDGGDEATMRVQVIVPTDAESFARAVMLRERVGHAAIRFDDDAVVVTEKLAAKYGLSVGDAVVLFEQDATGTVAGEGRALVVTGVAENYVGNLVYVGRRAWGRVSDDELVFATLLATTTPDAKVRASLADDLHDGAHVSTVVFSDETIDTYRTMLSVVDMIVVVLVVSAGALAFIVLYNLTNINVAERVREIASLKVLGFTRREVYAYVFREMLLLAVIGAGAGMALGTWLATFVITTAEVDYVMFGRTIHPPSYAYAFVLTVVFAAGIAFAMRRKLDRVDMVESLKSVE